MREPPQPTAVIAEDEPQIAADLVRLLKSLWPELQVVQRASDGVAAVHAIERCRPTLAFLDIQMPQLSGLDVARQVSSRCHVVFITAFDQHALEAFEAGAIDYVLKPATAPRLLATVARLKSRIGDKPRDLSNALPVLDRGSPSRDHLQWISASRGDQVRLITVEEVLYFRSDAKYTLVVTRESESLIRKTIKELADELDPTLFWQVHRSAIVNLRAIDSVFHPSPRTLAVRLRGRSETLPVAEGYHHLFRQM